MAEDEIARLAPGPSLAALEAAFRRGVPEVVEDGLAPLPALPNPGAGGRLSVVVSARTAMETDLAVPFCDALSARVPLSVDQLERIGLAVQEALANAVLHGSLEMGGRSRETADDFLHFSETLAARLADPAYGARPVALWAMWGQEEVTVGVVDAGPGYRAEAIAAGPLPEASGRGLMLIDEAADALRIEDEGRWLAMVFRR